MCKPDFSNSIIIEMEMNRAGLAVEYVLAQYSDTPEGELMKLMKAGIAQYENRQRTERSRRGKRGRVQAGFVLIPAARAPFGYDYVSEKHKGWLVPNPQQAEVVKLMFKWLVEDGLSSYAIARKLWEEGILSKGDTVLAVVKKFGKAQWAPPTVRRILSSPVYKGTWYYGKTRRRVVGGKETRLKVPESEWIAVDVPAIVDEDMWNRAQVCLQKNKQESKRNTKREYLLRGMVFCPCSRRWTGIYKNHLKRAYYRCPSNEAEHWRHRCDNRFSIRQESLECAVWEKVTSFFVHPELLKLEIERERADSEKATEASVKRLQAIDDLLADLDRQMAILLDDMLTAGFAKTLVEEKKGLLITKRAELEAEAGSIRERLRETTVTPEQETEIMSLAHEIGQGIREVTFAEKRRFLELLRLRVDVLSRSQVRLSGVISRGLIVNIPSA